ncbi:MAG: 3-dehydroquinate synthase [Bacteroidetes bacterium]|nr:3-dehydroquinate synthase [Bacteroidota bacterium]
MSLETTFFFQDHSHDFIQFLNQKKYSKIFLLADSHTNGFCLPLLKQLIPEFCYSCLIVIPAGEAHKNIDVCQLIWNALLLQKADKHSVLVNVGGGMVSDIGAFAASTYKRGIDFVNIPTTLLAMVDASFGGKNGIDFDNTKNAIGSFTNPSAVYFNTHFLKTLPNSVLRSGIAEILKHSLLDSIGALDETLDLDINDFFSSTVIQKSIAFKSAIVQIDPHDEGIRQSLNLGHSIGHALESFMLYAPKPLLHGEAVLLGLIYELMISHLIFQLPIEIVQKVIAFKDRIFADLKCPFDYIDIEKFIGNDKKNRGEIRMSLLEAPGTGRWQVPVSVQQLKTAITETKQFLAK